jgi:hypothetical protein
MTNPKVSNEKLRAKYQVGLVTSAAFPDLIPGDRLLLDALTRRGLEARPVVWDDPGVDWRALKVSVVRSTWDYHHRLGEFLAWAERVATLTRLWNPVEVLRWNTHKSYLRDLAARSIPTVPTILLKAGSTVDLASLLARAGWQEVVIKPAVSAAAHETIRAPLEGLKEGQAHVDRLLPAHDLLVQPYMRSVSEHGERSLIFIQGELTHAVRRSPVLEIGHARAWEEIARVAPAPEEIELARRAVQAAGAPLLYARVDIVRDDAGSPLLMELEVVEPYLFFELAPEAAERCAGAIAVLCDAC